MLNKAISVKLVVMLFLCVIIGTFAIATYSARTELANQNELKKENKALLDEKDKTMAVVNPSIDSPEAKEHLKKLQADEERLIKQAEELEKKIKELQQKNNNQNNQ